TFSIQDAGGPTKRYDYILPCAMLFSNIAGRQVFRTDLLPSPLPPLLTNDDVTASDHLPVLMVFSLPANPPFRINSIGMSNRTMALKWESEDGRQYGVDTSPDLVSWSVLASNLT